jgi:UDPglucose 6-dehydrogenase
MKVLCVGYGYVGSAIGTLFTDEEKIIIDPKFDNLKISNFVNEKIDCSIVCVDTPKGQNTDILSQVLEELNALAQKQNRILNVLTKSTTNPKFFDTVLENYSNISLVFSPEHLTGRNNFSDFENQKFAIFGGNSDTCDYFINIFKNRHNNIKEYVKTDIKTAALLKYAENAFLSTKVTFMNEMYKIHSDLDCQSDFKDFSYMFGLDERIGSSHTQVPGWDGEFGWGGHCFTKDNDELIKFSDSELFKLIYSLNDKHRNAF